MPKPVPIDPKGREIYVAATYTRSRFLVAGNDDDGRMARFYRVNCSDREAVEQAARKAAQFEVGTGEFRDVLLDTLAAIRAA